MKIRSRTGQEQLTPREQEILQLIIEGHSDREVARDLYLSVNTVKWHARNIYAKLGVSSRTQAIAAAREQGLLESQSLDGITQEICVHNLPAPVSSFIGRQEEIHRIHELLDTSRLLTLTGPGGVGKTRLALQAATEMVGKNIYRDGVFLVELAPIQKHEWVAGAIVEGLGLFPFMGCSSEEQLEQYLADKQILLLIDNFEHVLEAAPLVSQLLRGAADLKVLCTSREALHLSGEQLYPVPPMTLPASQASLLSDRASWPESISLFIDRALCVKPDFSLDDKVLNSVSKICARLDGLPLAIELAAARINAIPPSEMVSMLGDRFQLLKDAPRDADEKHQSLRRALDWSYDLLSSDERILLNRLGVFQGGWSAEAVGEICCQDLDFPVPDGLESLLAKSLIQQIDSSREEPRYFMLETVHAYARQQLEETKEIDQIRAQHARFFSNLAGQAREPLRDGWDTIMWMDRLEADHENLRAAFEHSLQSDEVEIGLRLIGDLPDYWIEQGYYQEGKTWIERGLDLVEQVPVEVQARVYFAAGLLCYSSNQLSQARKMYDKALPLFQKLDDPISIGSTYIAMADTAAGNPDDDSYFREHIERALEYMQELDHKPGIHTALTNLGVHEAITGRYPQARENYKQALILARELGQEIRESVNLVNFSILILKEGDALAAYEKMKQSLRLLRGIGYKSPTLKAGPLSYCACVAIELRKIEEAVVLFGASDALFRRKGFRPLPESEPFFEKNKQKARSLLNEADFERAWSKGQAMSAEQAITYALEEVSP